MAQIFKYQSGGSTSASPHKYGTFTIDNETYQVDDNFIKQMHDYSKTLDDRVGQQFGNIIDALKSGENISFDSSGTGTLTGNVNFNVTEDQDERMSKSRRRFGNFLGHIWNGREQTAREAISALKDFTYTPPAERRNKYDWSRKLQGEYVKGEDGKYVVNNGARSFVNGANNIAILNRLSNLKDIANYKDNDIFEGYGNLDKQAYINFYNHLGEKGIQELYNRVKNGTWTDADADALDDIGIFLRESTDNNPTTTTIDPTEKATRDRFTKAGLDYDKSNSYITIDDNGEIRITDAFNQAFGNRSGIYNDWWENYLTKEGKWSPDFSWLKGYTRVGNRLYRTSDLENENSELYNFAHQDGGFYDLNTQNKFSEANKILEYLWGRPDESSTWDNTHFYNKWMSQQDPSTFRYRSLSGQYELPEGQQLIEYWTGNERDMFGRPTEYSYAVFDKDGNLIEDKVDISKYKFIDGKQLPFEPLKRIVDQNSPYNGRYIRTFIDSDKNPIEDVALYINPEDESDMIYYAKDLSKRSGIKGQNVRIPRELAAAINNNPEFWNKLLSDKTLQDRFYRSLQEGVSTTIGEGLRNINFLTSPSTLTVTDLMSLGFDQNTAQNLYNYLENDWGDRNGKSASSRRDSRLVNPYVTTNQPVESHQTGGKIGTTVDNVGKDSVKNVGKYRDVEQVAGAHDDWNLSTADKLEFASLAGDIASLITSIPTAGNPVAGVLGYGSSLTQLAADIKRDGFDWKDLTNLAINLGLDTVTLLPGIGVGGKAAKLVKAVKKVAKPLKKYFLLAGATQGVQGVTNLVNGNGTIDDWKSVLNGLQSIVGAGRAVKDIRATRYKGKAPEVKGVTKEQLRNEYVDKVVKEKGLGKDKPIDGIDNNGNVTDYKKAIASLTESGDLKITKAQEAKWATEAAASATKARAQNMFSGSYNPFSRNFRYRMSNRQLPEDFDLTQLAGHTSKLRTIGRLATENPEIATQLRNQGWSLPETFNFRSNYGGNWFYRSPVFTRINSNTPKITDNRFLLPRAASTPVTNTPTNTPRVTETPITINTPKIDETISLPVDRTLLSLPSSRLRFLLPRRAGQWVSLPDGQGMIYQPQRFKKGGKLIKAQTGTKLSISIPKIKVNNPYRIEHDFTNQWNKDFSDTLGQTNYVGTTNHNTNNTTINTDINDDWNRDFSDVLGMHYNFTDQWNKDFGDVLGKTDYVGTTNNPIINQRSQSGSGEEPQKRYLNPDMIMGLSDFILSSRGINRSADKMKEAIRKGMLGSQSQMPTEIYPTFTDNGLYRMADQRLNNIRRYKSVTSDSREALAERLMRDSMADQIIADRNTNFSKQISDYKNQVLGLKQQYADMRRQIADENRNKWAQGEAQLDMTEANRISQQTQNAKNLIYQFRQNHARDLERRNAAEEQLLQSNAQVQYRNELLKLFNQKGGFSAMSNSEKEQFGNDWAKYAEYKYSTEAGNLWNNIIFAAKKQQANSPYVRNSWWRSVPDVDVKPVSLASTPAEPEIIVHSNKKGGKIKRFRDVDEQHYLDQQKAINKAVNDLNNNVIKLFSKMMS